jgi:putative ABC transport system ATP-binding protein
MELLKVADLKKTYTSRLGGAQVQALSGVSFTVERGEYVAIMGESGSGKTTLLSLLAALTSPSEGSIYVNGNDIFKNDTYRYRAKDVGIVFQNYNLLPKMNAVENVVLSMDISGINFPDKRKRAVELLESLGIAEYDLKRPVLQLSGGQQQRVAMARAISYEPPIILADEPTGNLDENTEKEIMKIFDDMAHRAGKCVIIVTHSKQIAAMADVMISIEDLSSRDLTHDTDQIPA